MSGIIGGMPLWVAYLDALEKGCNKTGVVSGCDVTADGTAMAVSVAAGTVGVEQSSFYDVTAASLTIAAADATYIRYDTVVFDTSVPGLTVLTGTASATPAPPKPGATQILLAVVKVSPGTTVITADDVTDCRIFVPGKLDSINLKYDADADGIIDLTALPSIPNTQVGGLTKILSGTTTTVPDLSYSGTNILTISLEAGYNTLIALSAKVDLGTVIGSFTCKVNATLSDGTVVTLESQSKSLTATGSLSFLLTDFDYGQIPSGEKITEISLYLYADSLSSATSTLSASLAVLEFYI